MLYHALTYLPYDRERDGLPEGVQIVPGREDEAGRYLSPVVQVAIDVGDINAFGPDEKIKAIVVDDEVDDAELDCVGMELIVRRQDLFNIEPANGLVLGWLEKQRLMAKAWFYRQVTGLLVKINKSWIAEGSPDHRYYYWYVKDNGSVVRVAQHGSFRCDNWRPIVDELDLEEFHQDLRRYGYWSAV